MGMPIAAAVEAERPLQRKDVEEAGEFIIVVDYGILFLTQAIKRQT